MEQPHYVSRSYKVANIWNSNKFNFGNIPGVDLEIVDTIEDDDEDKLVINEDTPEYINLPKNPHGKVVYNPEKDMPEYYNEQNDNVSEIDVHQYGKLLLYQGKNIVSFVHPTYQKHEVLCRSIDDVIKWIGYHVKEERRTNNTEGRHNK